jgi:hypothetical protein
MPSRPVKIERAVIAPDFDHRANRRGLNGGFTAAILFDRMTEVGRSRRGMTVTWQPDLSFNQGI